MSSHRQVFKSSAIIGGASAVNIVIGIVKVKVLAVLLGPAGVGLMGLYQNIMGMASTLAGCGIASSGVRQLAALASEAQTLAIVRSTLWLSNLILGLLGMIVLWLIREPVALWVFGENTHVDEVGWLGLGVLLNLIASSQTALLQGLRRIGDIARINIISAVFGAVAGITLVYCLEEDGVLWFLLSAPAISILVAGYYARRLPRPVPVHDWQAIGQQWQAMLKVGIPFMATSVFGFGMQLAARSMIAREHGLDAVGHFQAAWAISMTYIGFVLSAMGTDYYPRLTSIINDHPRARKMVTEQSEMALLLASPVLLGMITTAPWVIHLLYAESFSPAIVVLRWQVLGDILKVACWPLGFILLARGNGKTFFVTEQIWNLAYLGVIFFGVRAYGIVSAGVGFAFAYLISYGVILVLAAKLIGLRLPWQHSLTTVLLLSAGALITYLSAEQAIAAYVVGTMLTLVAGIHSVYRIDSLINFRAWLKEKKSRS